MINLKDNRFLSQAQSWIHVSFYEMINNRSSWVKIESEIIVRPFMSKPSRFKCFQAIFTSFYHHFIGKSQMDLNTVSN